MSDGSTTDPTSTSPEAGSSPNWANRSSVENRASHVSLRFLVEDGRLTMKRSYWPVALCIAWISTRDPEAAVLCYALHRMWIEGNSPGEWFRAQQELLQALMKGTVEAHALGNDLKSPRTQISHADWLDLNIRKRGLFDQIARPDGTCAFRDARIAATQIYQQWPGLNAAQRTAASKRERETDCQAELERRMREKPDHPVTKRSLRPEFPDVSRRAFDSLFGLAVRTTKAFAWSTAGRRPKSRQTV